MTNQISGYEDLSGVRCLDRVVVKKIIKLIEDLSGRARRFTLGDDGVIGRNWRAGGWKMFLDHPQRS